VGMFSLTSCNVSVIDDCTRREAIHHFINNLHKLLLGEVLKLKGGQISAAEEWACWLF